MPFNIKTWCLLTLLQGKSCFCEMRFYISTLKQIWKLKHIPSLCYRTLDKYKAMLNKATRALKLIFSITGRWWWWMEDNLYLNIIKETYFREHYNNGPRLTTPTFIVLYLDRSIIYALCSARGTQKTAVGCHKRLLNTPSLNSSFHHTSKYFKRC